MMIFLTGAEYSLTKVSTNPQVDPLKSLGGYISSSPVPNGALNSLFDLVSSATLIDRPKETIAVALMNKFDYDVNDVELKIAVPRDAICAWRVAAVAPDANMATESIPNRYAEPLNAEFYDATFVRAAVDFEITTPPVAGESFAILPLGLVVELKDSENGIEGAWIALKRACKLDGNFQVIRLSEKGFRVAYKDETEVEDQTCSLVTDGGMRVEFKTEFKNDAKGSVYIADSLAPGEAVVLWLQREISEEYQEPTDEQLLEYKKRGVILPTQEETDIVITTS